MDEQKLLIAVGLMSLILLGLVSILQFSRKKYREASFNLLSAVAFFILFYAMSMGYRVIGLISVFSLICVNSIQVIFLQKEYKATKKKEELMEEK